MKYWIFLIGIQLSIANGFSFVEVSESQNISIGEDIDQFLVHTENLRTSNSKLFSSKLNSLQAVKGSLTDLQSCYFQYLNAYQLSYSGEFHKAKTQLKELFDNCRELKTRVRIKALLANLSIISGQYQDSINHIDYVISNIDNVKGKATKHIAYTASFIVYQLLDQWQLSLKFTNLLINDKPQEALLCKAQVYKYFNLLKLNSEMDRSLIKGTIKFCDDVGEKLYSQMLNVKWLKFRVDNSTNIEELNQIKELIKLADPKIHAIEYKNLIGMKNSLMAVLFAKLKKVDQAIYYAELSIKGSVSIGSTKQKIEALQILINYYQDIKDFEKANKYLQAKNLAEYKFHTDKREKVTAFQTVKHSNLANLYQIKELNQKNQLLELTNQLTDKSKKNLRLINLLFAIVIAFFVFIIIKVVKQKNKFRQLSELDSMTLIYNRKGIKDYMESLLPNAKKENEIIGYIIFDLDLFKRVNDVYGHIVGDWVIKQSIQVCKDLNNDKATFARLGGEEFSIIIRETDIDEVIMFSDEFRKAIHSINTLDGSNHKFEISASFGITTTEISGYDYIKLMTHADNALYYSKENGRNRLTIYHPYKIKE